jgi:hypothetical protein
MRSPSITTQNRLRCQELVLLAWGAAAEPVLMGKRVNMAARARRRALVAMLYSAWH